MTAAVYLPLVVAVVLALAGPVVTRRLAPAPAAWTLVATSIAVAAASLASLGLLAWTVVAELPPVAALGRWRPGAVGAASPVPTPVAVAALVLLGAVGWRCLRRVGALVSEARAAARLERRVPSRGRPPRVVVVDDVVPAAHAVAGLPGCGGHIVVTSGVLAALDDGELRRAVYEHERAHLRHHHGAIRVVCGLAVAVNPLLRTAHARVAYLLERWADEDAATHTGRAVTAEALAVVSLAALPAPSAMAFDTVGVPDRIGALLDGTSATRSRAIVLWCALAALVAVSAVAVIRACLDTEIIFETIRRWYLLRR
jgi:Zn-dependent protease with chaperone function